MALREVWDGRVWAATPARVVEDREDRTVFFVPSDAHVRRPAADDGSPMRLPDREWELQDQPFDHGRVLSFTFPETPYAILAFWDRTTDRFTGWYVNLQDPVQRTTIGFDTRDVVLDVVIPPDRTSWEWKDEGEVELALERGLLSHEDVARARAAGERAVERLLLREPPFDEPWEAWEPDPAWSTTELPARWDAVPA